MQRLRHQSWHGDQEQLVWRGWLERLNHHCAVIKARPEQFELQITEEQERVRTAL